MLAHNQPWSSTESGPHPHGIGGPLSHKYVMPDLPRRPYARPRLTRLMAELLEIYSVVELVACPGSGKTVQAGLFARDTARPVAWLTLDEAARSASRFLFDLAGALAEFFGDSTPEIQRTLRDEGTPAEAAAVLAGRFSSGAECLLVIDECQHISASPAAASALDTFLEYIPETMRVLLISRDDLPQPLRRRYVHGRIGQVNDDALNLTPDEVREYAASQGVDSGNARTIHELTGGWFVGVAFACRFGVREQPDLRDLSAYLGAEIFDRLPADEQEFLLATSVLEVVSRDLAVALCGPDSHRVWDALSRRHLPATKTSQQTIVYHSLFRTFLHDRLLADRPGHYSELMRRQAVYLTSAGQYEAATEASLAIGDLDAAGETAARASKRLYPQADWPVLDRWLRELGEERVQRDPRLVGASIRTAYGLREFDRARALIRRTDREGRLRAAAEADPELLMAVVSALVSRPQEAQRLLDKYDVEGREVLGRYMIESVTRTGGAAPSPPLLETSVGGERALSWGLFVQGRLRELSQLAPEPGAAPVLNANVVLAHALLGNLEHARELWARIPLEARDRPHSHYILAMLLIVEKRLDEAKAELDIAASRSRLAGFPLTEVYELFAAHFENVTNPDKDPEYIFEPFLESFSAAGQTAYLEWTQMFLGMGYLLYGRVGEARLVLREAVTSMVQCQRRLTLPFAAALLSEAEALEGEEKDAREAVELAYHATVLTGTTAGLLAIVGVFPGVLSRAIEWSPGDVRWRRLRVAPSARPASRTSRLPESGAAIRLQPFGRERDIWRDGRPTRIGRIKVLELVALLASHPHGLDRFELQQRLFPETDQRNGGNHFRQIAHKLKLGTGISLDRRGNVVMLPADVPVVSADIEFERMIELASCATGQERVDQLETALNLVSGPYLDGSVLSWVEERRNCLDLVQEEARLELARSLLQLNRHAEARSACEKALKVNKYADGAYRILMQIERQVGSESSALAVFRRAQESLNELGLRPGDALRLLSPAVARTP